MGKEGPCRHCGIEQTPLWRNGPPEKPVLCNACGSRWRTRGTLDDYIPKHAMKDAQGIKTESGSGSSSGTSQVVFENAPRRERSTLDQYTLTPIGRLTRQLLDFVEEQPEVFLNKPVGGDALIDRGDVTTFTPLETALGAVLLNPPHEETIAPDLRKNNNDQEEPPTI